MLIEVTKTTHTPFIHPHAHMWCIPAAAASASDGKDGGDGKDGVHDNE